MKRSVILSVLMLGACLAACSTGVADNQAEPVGNASVARSVDGRVFRDQPLVTEVFTADPSAHVFNGKIYVYPSHDIDAGVGDDDLGNQYAMRDYRVLSMDRIGGPVTIGPVALDVKDVPWASQQMWAPDAAYKNGTYYLYFPARDKTKDKNGLGAFRIGVARSKNPMGPFTPEPNYIPGSFSMDPAVFTDDDGTSYMYFGGIWGGQLQRWKDGVYDPNGSDTDLKQDDKPAISGKVVKMGADMKTFAEPVRDAVILDEKGKPVLGGDHDRRFFEAAWVFKRGGKYYFTYSTGDTHFVNYAIGDNPYGPFTFKGHILKPVQGWTSHHSIVEWDGRWWLFYHDTQLSGKNHLRSAKVTELKFNPDGTIPTIDPFLPLMFLGIDIGTSGVKAVALDETGAVAGQGTAALTVQRPQPGWSEQDPAAWWLATTAAVQAIDPAVRRSIRGVGIAGQMHGATLLDAEDRPLRPAILWNDGRCDIECEELEAAVPDLRQVTGNIAMPGFTAPKLLWVRKHEPDLFAQVRTVLLPKDYVRLMMTGDKASDLSDSAGTLWVDVARRDWSDEILAATGLSQSAMPKLFEGSEVTGSLRREVAELWGMPQVPVVAGGGDNAAGAVGVGVVRNGDALLSLGTSGVIFVATDRFRPNPARAVHAFCHCLPGMWHQMSVHLSAASCIDWVARLTGAAGAADLFARAEAAGPGAGEELFLPYLSGERTPHNDARVRGAFLGLDNDTDPGRLARAVLEGVAFALADGLDALRDAGTQVSQLSVIGGGARSGYWGRIIAAAFEVPLVYLKGGEVGPALGAARLAQLAVDGGDPASVCAAPPVSQRIEPETDLIDRLAARKALFRQAYPRITPKKGH